MASGVIVVDSGAAGRADAARDERDLRSPRGLDTGEVTGAFRTAAEAWRISDTGAEVLATREVD